MGGVFNCCCHHLQPPFLYLRTPIKSPNPSWSSSPSSSSLRHIFYIAAMPSSSPVTVLYCSQRDGRVGLYDPVIGNNTMVNTYYQSPKPELVLLPSPSFLPSVMFFTLLL